MRKLTIKMTDEVEINFISFKDTEFVRYTMDGETVYEAIKEYFTNHFECESEATIVTKRRVK